MTVFDYLTMAAKGLVCAWLILMVLGALLLIREGLKPYWRRWTRKHGRRGTLPAQVFQIADFRHDNENAPARVRVAEGRPTRSNPS